MIQALTVLASSEQPQGIAALGIDPITILIQGGTFLLFFLIVKKFALGKIVTTLEERRKTIEDSLQKADDLTKQNAEAEKRVGQLLGEARKEAEGIVANAKKEAVSVVAEAEKSAKAKSEKIVEDGKKQIDAAVINARDALKKETLVLVAEATAAVLQETVDAKKSEELIKRALKDSEGKK